MAAALPSNTGLEAATSLHVWHQSLKTDPQDWGSAADIHAPGIAKVSLCRKHYLCGWCSLWIWVNHGHTPFRKLPVACMYTFNFCLQSRLETTAWNRQWISDLFSSDANKEGNQNHPQNWDSFALLCRPVISFSWCCLVWPWAVRVDICPTCVFWEAGWCSKDAFMLITWVGQLFYCPTICLRADPVPDRIPLVGAWNANG